MSFGEEQLKEAFRFNRYMVECECFSGEGDTTNTVNVLIDTWWNVNEDLETVHTMLMAF